MYTSSKIVGGVHTVGNGGAAHGGAMAARPRAAPTSLSHRRPSSLSKRVDHCRRRRKFASSTDRRCPIPHAHAFAWPCPDALRRRKGVSDSHTAHSCSQGAAGWSAAPCAHFLSSFNPSSAFVSRFCAITPSAAFLSFLLALYFLSDLIVSGSWSLGALPLIHGSLRT